MGETVRETVSVAVFEAVKLAVVVDVAVFDAVKLAVAEAVKLCADTDAEGDAEGVADAEAV